MFIYKIRPDGVYDGPVEVTDGTTRIPKGYTFSQPPEIPSGYYAVMSGGWVLVQGETPIYPPPPPSPPPPPPPPTPEQIQDQIVQATQNRLDDFARTRNYDGILSAATYASSTVQKFNIEGQYCLQSRDATWAKLYEILAEVQAGIRPMPSSYSDIESDLPVLTWPN